MPFMRYSNTVNFEHYLFDAADLTVQVTESEGGDSDSIGTATDSALGTISTCSDEERMAGEVDVSSDEEPMAALQVKDDDDTDSTFGMITEISMDTLGPETESKVIK